MKFDRFGTTAVNTVSRLGPRRSQCHRAPPKRRPGTASRFFTIIQAYCLGDPDSRQAIHQRYTLEAVAFFRAAHDHVLAEALRQPPLVSMAQALREHFRAVHYGLG